MIGWNSIPKYRFKLHENKYRGMNYLLKIGKQLAADLFEILFFRGKIDRRGYTFIIFDTIGHL